jgi:hypothetical protein
VGVRKDSLEISKVIVRPLKSPGGQRLADGVVTLQEPLTDVSQLQQRPVINLLHVPRLAAGKHDKPVIHELVENVPSSVKIEQAWIGEGSLCQSAEAKKSRTWPLCVVAKAYALPWHTSSTT